MKFCTRCNIEKEDSEFSKHNRKCKKCVSERKREYRLENKESISLKNKEYSAINKQKIAEYGKNHYEANKERKKEQRRKRYLSNCEKEKAQVNKYRIENGEYLKDCQRKRSKEHRGIFNAKTAKRRSAKMLRTPDWLTKEHLKEIEEFYIRAKEMEKETGLKYHVDHIIPLQGRLVSGLHVPWNLQIITALENTSKGNRIN